MRKWFGKNRVKILLSILVLTVLTALVGNLYLILKDSSSVLGANSDEVIAGSEIAVAYDWKSGKILNNFNKVSSSYGDDWELVKFYSEENSGIDTSFEIYTQVSEPQIGSRNIRFGDMGDDVVSLQAAINLVRTEDQTDKYYIPKLEVTGTYTSETLSAVKLLQDFFDLPANGEANLDFQTALYRQVITPEE